MNLEPFEKLMEMDLYLLIHELTLRHQLDGILVRNQFNEGLERKKLMLSYKDIENSLQNLKTKKYRSSRKKELNKWLKWIEKKDSKNKQKNKELK